MFYMLPRNVNTCNAHDIILEGNGIAETEIVDIENPKIEQIWRMSSFQLAMNHSLYISPRFIFEDLTTSPVNKKHR